MTLGDQLRGYVRHVLKAARSRGAGRARGIRVVDQANVVVARNVGARGGSREASAHQTVVVRDGAIHAHTEKSAVRDNATARQGKEPRE